MPNKVIARFILFEIGQNKESAEKNLAELIGKLKKEKDIIFYKCNPNPAEQTENNVWTTFAEVEFEIENFKRFFNLCVDYLPSNVEILDPLNVDIDSYGMADTLNGILTKLQDSKKKVLKAEAN